jgi:hypothetical protein
MTFLVKPVIFNSSELFYLPRPLRLHSWIRSRSQSKPDVNQLGKILAEFDSTLAGKVEATAEEGRSINLIIETSSGKKMLKRYKKW